jgi:hypothetical protein
MTISCNKECGGFGSPASDYFFSEQVGRKADGIVVSP